MSCRPRFKHSYIVNVQGKPYTLKGSEGASLRLVRASALKKHGLINYLNTGYLDQTWQVTDSFGNQLTDLSQPAKDFPEGIYINPRPGWGG